MLHRVRFLFALLIALSFVVVYSGCDRTKGTYNGNELPHVAFVNYPTDSTRFNYAPVVYWKGWDDDGLLTGFQYRDDTTSVTMGIFKDHPAEFQAYARSMSDSAWIRTDSTFATVFLLTSPGDTSEHLFMVRSVDDRGGMSDVAVHYFQRTNQPPDPPQLKWALDTNDYATNKVILDTLLWGDTLSEFYPGVQVLWKGTDPDTRALYVIPLQFSYLLINTDLQDTIPFRYYDADSVLVYKKDWSAWTSESQAVFFGQPTGNYLFQLRVRDDGYTPSSTIATLRFCAIKPTFEKQLLIVNQNHPLAPIDLATGGRDDQEIMNFYRSEVPEALQFAQSVYGNQFFPNTTIDYFDDSDDTTRVPYALINQYRWIWLISDDNRQQVIRTAVLRRQKVLEDYLNVGGGVMLSGRRLFTGNYFNESGPFVTGAKDVGQMFDAYFNVPWIFCKTFAVNDTGSSTIDFSGANTTNPLLSNLHVDSAVVCSLNWRHHYFCNLPEIDYFSRTNVSGSSYSETVYNYSSATVHDTTYAHNEDCDIQENYIVGGQTVILTDSTRAFLLVGNDHTRILGVSRIYNVTKGCYGEFMWVDRGGPSGAWRIVASTPYQHGVWTDQDVLQVDYTFIPTSPNQDQPVAMNFTSMQGQTTYDEATRSFIFAARILFRSSIFTFPLSFMDNTPDQYGIKPLTRLIAYEAFYFNQPRVIRYGGGQ